MSWRTLESAHTVITRKEHVCYGCGRRWPSGSKLVTWVMIEGGYRRPDRTYLCLICNEFANIYLSDEEELPMDYFVNCDAAAYAKIEGRLDMQLVVLQAGLYFKAGGLGCR